jgi:hypothetical protein
MLGRFREATRSDIDAAQGIYPTVEGSLLLLEFDPTALS